jgi:hypothetical protein
VKDISNQKKELTPQAAAFLSQLDMGHAPDGEPYITITPEASGTRELDGLEKVLGSAVYQEELFELRTKLNEKEKVLYPMGAGYPIYESARKWEETKSQFPLHKFTPLIAAFGAAVEKHSGDVLNRLPPLSQLSLQSDEFNHAAYAAFNNVIHDVKLKISEKKFMNAKDGQRRGANSNYQSLMLMTNAAFVYRSEILSIRVDLYYKRDSSMQMLNLNDEDRLVKADRFHRHLNHVMHRVRKRFGVALVGYAWKKEFGKSRGLHVHLWVLLDGHLHQQGINLADEIGGMWLAATFGEGDFNNCNKSFYVNTAVGVLDASDEDKWVGLQNIMAYLTKADTIIRLELGDGRRVFSCSQPKERTGTRGRPPLRRRALSPFINRRGDRGASVQ